MSTLDQKLSSRRTGNTGQAFNRVSQRASFTFADNGTVKAQITLPASAARPSIQIENPTTFTGTPTSAMFRAGTTDTGQEIVADVDAKAAGHIASTIVAGYNRGVPLASQTILYLQVVVVGGIAPVGTIYAFVDYDAPTF